MVGHTERNQTVENVVKRARKTDPKVELKCLRVIIQFLPRTDVFDCYCWWSNNLRMNVEWHLNCNCLAVNEKKCKDAWWFVYDGSSPTNVDKFELLKSLEWIPPLSPGFSLRKWLTRCYSTWILFIPLNYIEISIPPLLVYTPKRNENILLPQHYRPSLINESNSAMDLYTHGEKKLFSFLYLNGWMCDLAQEINRSFTEQLAGNLQPCKTQR